MSDPTRHRVLPGDPLTRAVWRDAQELPREALRQHAHEAGLPAEALAPGETLRLRRAALEQLWVGSRSLPAPPGWDPAVVTGDLVIVGDLNISGEVEVGGSVSSARSAAEHSLEVLQPTVVSDAFGAALDQALFHMRHTGQDSFLAAVGTEGATDQALKSLRLPCAAPCRALILARFLRAEGGPMRLNLRLDFADPPVPAVLRESLLEADDLARLDAASPRARLGLLSALAKRTPRARDLLAAMPYTRVCVPTQLREWITLPAGEHLLTLTVDGVYRVAHGLLQVVLLPAALEVD